ncbi:SAM-dependent methyltransferase [Spirochaetia bacterium]|nr:SAM-dependent methyltransferase [Spirochaetia bacterium]
MAINEKLIRDRYSNAEREDNRATRSRAYGIEFYFTKKILDKYINLESNVIEIGCGTGYYGMYLADKCKNYTGIDITEENIKVFENKIMNKSLKNVNALVGDATNLNNITDNYYDVVLVFGPMYHLCPEERDMVFKESKRICKNDGIIIYAYINKLGAYLQPGILGKPDVYPNKKANEYLLEKETDDIMPGIFYYTTPHGISNRAKYYGLNVIKNVGVDFLFNMDQINNMDEEKYKYWIEFSEYMCSDESCTGLSIHALLICKK